MKTAFAHMIFCLLTGCALSQETGARGLMQIEQAPDTSDEMFRSSLYDINRNVLFNDWKQKLTVLKDADRKACYVVDLDNDFYLNGLERDTILTNYMPDSDPVSFPFRVGPFVQALCHDTKVYWPRQIPPALQPRPAINSPSTITGVNVPPPVSVYRAQQVAVPPPVNVYRQDQTSKPSIVAPPSLGVYLSQQANQASQQKAGAAGTPPPPALYLAELNGQNAPAQP